MRRSVIEGRFAEGCAPAQGLMWVLTWRERELMLFDLDTLELRGVLGLPSEGWGLAHTPDRLIYSDGSSELRWIDPEQTLSEQRLIITRSAQVRERSGELIYQLNELEWFEGYLLANIYLREEIAVISLTDARVALWVDLSALRALEPPEARELNGIAYDAQSDLIWVTGKGWSGRYALDAQALRAQITMISSQ